MDHRPDYALDSGRLVSSAALLASSGGFIGAPTPNGIAHRSIPIPQSPLPPVTSGSSAALDSLYSAYHGRCASSSLAVTAGPSYSSLLSGCFDDAATPAVSPFRPPSSSLPSMNHLWPPVLPSDEGTSSCNINSYSSHFCLCKPPASTYASLYDTYMGYARCGMNSGLYSVFSMVSGSDGGNPSPYYSRSVAPRLTSQTPYQHLCEGSKGNDTMYSPTLQMRSMIPPLPPTQHIPPSLSSLQCNSLAQMEFFTKRLETNSFCLPPSLPHTEFWRADEIRTAETSHTLDVLSTNTGRKRDRHHYQQQQHHHHHRPKQSTTCQPTKTVVAVKHKEKLAVKKEVWPTWQTPVVTSIGTATTTTLTQTTSVGSVSTTNSSVAPYDSRVSSPYVFTQPMGVVLDYSKKSAAETCESAFPVEDDLPEPTENLLDATDCEKPVAVDGKETANDTEEIATGDVHEDRRCGLVSGEKDASSQQFVFEWEPPSRSQFSPTFSRLIQNPRTASGTPSPLTPKTVIATIRSSPNSGLDEAPILHIPSPPLTSPKNDDEQTEALALVTNSTADDKPDTSTVGNSSVASGSYHIPVGIAVARQRQEPSPSNSTGKHRTDDSVANDQKNIPSTSHRIRSFTDDTKDVTKQITRSEVSNSVVNSEVQWEGSIHNVPATLPPPPPPPPWLSTTQSSAYWLPQGSYAATVPLSMQIGTSIEPNHQPIPPVGYQLARDSLTGHLLLIPTNIDIMDRTSAIWPTTYASSTSQQLMIRQQILQQERSVEYRLDVPTQLGSGKELDDSEDRNGSKTLAVAPFTQMTTAGIPVATYGLPTAHSYFYDTLSGSVMQLAQAVQTETGRRSQGTSPAVPDDCLSADGEPPVYESDAGESARDGTELPPQVADASNQTETPPTTEDEEEMEKTDVAVQGSDCECDDANRPSEWNGLELLSNSIEKFEEYDRMPRLDVVETSESTPTVRETETKPPDIVSESRETPLPNNVIGLAGLGLLCALAEQKYTEEKWSEETPDINRNYRNGARSFVGNGGDCVEPKSPEMSMDSAEMEMRMRLAELQKRYKEKQKELARLQPKKDGERSPTKRGPGRPRKRKNSSVKTIRPLDNLVKTLVKLEASPPLLESVLDEAPRKKRKKSNGENEVEGAKKPILKPAVLNADKSRASENDRDVANRSMTVHIDLNKGQVKSKHFKSHSHRKSKLLLSNGMKKLEKKMKLHRKECLKAAGATDKSANECREMDGLGLLAQLVEEKCLKRLENRVRNDESTKIPEEGVLKKRKPGRPKKHTKWKDEIESIVVKKNKSLCVDTSGEPNEKEKKKNEIEKSCGDEKKKLKTKNHNSEKEKWKNEEKFKLKVHRPENKEKIETDEKIKIEPIEFEKIKIKTEPEEKPNPENQDKTKEKHEKPKTETKEKPKHKQEDKRHPKNPPTPQLPPTPPRPPTPPPLPPIIPIYKNSYLEDQSWNRRRSERIFLNDLNVVPSPGYFDDHIRCPPQLKPATEEYPTYKTKTDENLKPPKNLTRAPDTKRKIKTDGSHDSPKKQKKEKDRKKRCKDRSVSEELFQALKDKCCLSDASAVVGGLSPRDSDSDNIESSSYSEGETLPLIQLVDRPLTPEPRSAVIQSDELVDRLRVLVLMDGLFYAGHVNAIQAPDVYGVALDGERSNKAHIYSREEILKEAVKPGSVRRVPESSRVCAYWSQQYRCLYPGTVAKSPSPNPTDDKTTVYVEFDDGDSGKIPLGDIRLLPSSFPVISYDPSPLVYLGKKRSRSVTDSSFESKISANVSSSTDVGYSSVVKKSSKKRQDEYELKPKKWKKSKDDKSSNDSLKPESVVSKPKKHKKHRDEHRHHHHKHHHKHKHRHDRHDKPEKQKDNFKIPSTHNENATKTTPIVVSSSTTDNKKSELTFKIKTSAVDNVQTDVSSVADDSETGSTWDSSESSKFSSPSELDKDSDETSDEDYTVGGKPKPKKDEALRAKKRKERASLESKSKIAAFLPARQLWRWSGKSFKRPGTKGKAKKEFYKAITRGKETITVGDSAVFLSTGRPHLPYIGRIEMMWESWGGNMVVKVKWFYHPEETKGGRRSSDSKGALYESPHEDENDVQTISHKCEVLSWEECERRRGEAGDGSSLSDNDDVYYLAGHYDPTTGICSVQPGIC